MVVEVAWEEVAGMVEMVVVVGTAKVVADLGDLVVAVVAVVGAVVEVVADFLGRGWQTDWGSA